MRYSLADVTTLLGLVGLTTMLDSFCGLKHLVPSAKENIVSPTIASLVCVPANGVYKEVELLNGAKRHLDTNTLALASGREASAVSKSSGVRRPSSSPTSGFGAEFLKWLPETPCA